MENNPFKKQLLSKASILSGVGGLAVIAMASLGLMAFSATGDAALLKKLQPKFPNSKLHVNCTSNVKYPGFCEVDAGKGVYYATKDGHYFFVGQVLDLEKQVDMTDERQRELAALTNSLDKVDGGVPMLAQANLGAVGNAGPAGAPANQGAPVMPTQFDMAELAKDLPANHAVIYNAGAPIKIKVFSDYNCPHCRDLFASLETQKDIEVTEYPMGILGADSVTKAKIVLCSKDRVAAAHTAYSNGQISTVGDCKDAGQAVTENRTFADAHGIGGTPAIIRADGKAISGFGTIEQVRAFATGKV